MFLILATQKATTDSMPGQIRDNAALSLALSQKTMDAAVAALGSAIRDYPSFSPTTLQGPEYTGCAVATMRTGQDPFTRLRLPGVTRDELQAAAAAHRASAAGPGDPAARGRPGRRPRAGDRMSRWAGFAVYAVILAALLTWLALS